MPSNDGEVRSEELKFSKTSPTENEKSFDSKGLNLKENDLIKINQNIKDIETISTQVFYNTSEEDSGNEFNNSIEILDFEEVNDLDSSQIEFDFNEPLGGSKKLK
ncbi:MAG: hypothetical protein ACJ0P5_01575 [Flavobacteriaceae bacterium]